MLLGIAPLHAQEQPANGLEPDAVAPVESQGSLAAAPSADGETSGPVGNTLNTQDGVERPALRPETGQPTEPPPPDGVLNEELPGIESLEEIFHETPAPGPASVTDAETEGGPDAGNAPLDQPATPADAPGAGNGPRDVVVGLWRVAVADGSTTLGFDAWLSEVFGTQPQPEPPAPLDQAGRTRAVSAVWDRRTGPVAAGRAGRVVTTFGEAIPTAFCSPLTVCTIELEPGEVLTDTPSWGDTARWQVTAKRQGRDPERVVLEIKPSDDATATNMVIPTDRRLYTITLENDPKVHTPILSFLYPDTQARAIAAAIEEREAADAAAEAAAQERSRAAEAARTARLARSGVPTTSGARDASELDFGFQVSGQAPFRPVRVFSDGQRTYIDLHPDYRGALPAIVPGDQETNAALNTRVTENGTRLVADRVIRDVWLQSGRQRVRIQKAGS